MLFVVILTTLLPLGVDACLGLLLGCSSCCSRGSYSYYPVYQQPYSYYRPQQYSYQTPRAYQQSQVYLQQRVQPQYSNPVYYSRPAVPVYSQVPTGSYPKPSYPPNLYQNVVNSRPQVQVNGQPSSSFIPGSSQVPFVPPRAVGPTYVPHPQAILIETTTEKVLEEFEESGSIIGDNNTYGEEMTEEETLEEVEQTPAPVRKLITNSPRVVVTVPSIESEAAYAPEQLNGGEYEDEVTSPPEEEEYPEEYMKGPVRTTPSSVSLYIHPVKQETPAPFIKEESYSSVPETSPPYVPPSTDAPTVSYSVTDAPAENYPEEGEEEQVTYVPTIPPVIETNVPFETLASYAQPTATDTPLQKTTAPPPVEEVEYIEEEEETTTEALVPPAVEEKQFEEETEDSAPVDGGAGDGEESGGYVRRISRKRSH